MSHVDETWPNAPREPSDLTPSWVNEWLSYLHSHLGLERNGASALLDPTPDFYAELDSGDDHDLQSAVMKIGQHIGVGILPVTEYELGLRVTPEAAGEIAFRAGCRSRIRIPLFYVGKRHELGAILAHEMTHHYLALHGITDPDEQQNERITDLASFTIGLGKLVLNGTVFETAAGTGETQALGYLPLSIKACAYQTVNQLHGVSDAEALTHLTPIARSILTTTPPGV